VNEHLDLKWNFDGLKTATNAPPVRETAPVAAGDAFEDNTSRHGKATGEGAPRLRQPLRLTPVPVFVGRRRRTILNAPSAPKNHSPTEPPPPPPFEEAPLFELPPLEDDELLELDELLDELELEELLDELELLLELEELLEELELEEACSIIVLTFLVERSTIRMAEFPVSATKSFPEPGSTTRDCGFLNKASEPVPSRNPARPAWPTKVVTTPACVTSRMVEFPVSAT
jgi:hypothetical protein